MNKKKLFPYFIFYVVTVLSSIVAVILYIKYFPIESKIITENINKTIVTMMQLLLLIVIMVILK